MTAAVITTDVVNSTLMDRQAEKKIRRMMDDVLKGTLHTYYRGDSLQVYVADADDALRLLLRLRSITRMILSAEHRFDLKGTIGIGKVQKPLTDLAHAKGQAFVLSGRAFDEKISGTTRCAIRCGKEPHDTAFDVISLYIDDIFASITPSQAAVVGELLTGATQTEVAKSLKKSQPVVSKMAAAARWPAVVTVLEKFQTIVKTPSL